MSDISTTTPFKLIVFGFFFLFAAMGAVMFAMYQASGTESNNVGNISIWGTLPQSQVAEFFSSTIASNTSIRNISYVYIEESAFDERFTDALASGYGPDMILLSNKHILRHKDRLYTIPYEEFDARSFKDMFAQPAHSLMSQDGLLGMPVAIDPLVLYWNRTILSINKYPLPPSQWGEIFEMSRSITQKNENGDLEISAIALGETSNVLHFKDIFVAMLQQAGGSITKQMPDGSRIASLQDRNTQGTLPAQDALRFFTQFSNPTKNIYTWNKSMPLDRDAFVQGRLAMYIGYASELSTITEQNPNLIFDVAILPRIQGAPGENQATFAQVYTLTVPRVSKNISGARFVLYKFTNASISSIFSEYTNLPSPINQLLSVDPDDALQTVFRNSAIMAQSWMDPDSKSTRLIIEKMINSVTSGEKRMSEAISRAQRELEVLLK